MVSLSRQERHLIIIQGLLSFTEGLAGIFVTVFLFAQSDLRTTVLFRFWSFASLLFFYVLSGWTLRRMSSALIMKIALLAGALFYFLLFVLQAKTIQYIVPLGILDGFVGGNYWAAYNLNQYIFTSSERRIHYFGWSTAIVNFLSAVAPLIGGVIITIIGAQLLLGVRAGYAALFFVVFLLLLATVIFIGKLPSHEIPAFSYRHLFRGKRAAGWVMVLWQQALLGFYDVSLGTITAILFYLILRTEFWLGLSQTIGFLLSAVFGVVSAKLLEKNTNYYWVGSLGLALAIGVFGLYQTSLGLWIFIIVSGIASPFLGTWLSAVYFHALDSFPEHWRDKYHLMIERDAVLGVLRVVSFFLLYLFLAHGNQIVLAETWLRYLWILPLAIGILLWQSAKKLSGKTETKV